MSQRVPIVPAVVECELDPSYLLDESSEGHWFWVEKEVARYGPFPSREAAIAAAELHLSSPP